MAANVAKQPGFRGTVAHAARVRLDTGTHAGRVCYGDETARIKQVDSCRLVRSNTTMQDTAAEFLASITKRTATLCAVCPGFEVFALTEGKLLAAISRLGFQPQVRADYLAMHELREALLRQPGDETPWALAYIDLWYCSNFHGGHWRTLVCHDHRNIRYAIQAALYVWWDSGCDDPAEVARLIEDCACRSEAQAYLRDLAERPEWDWWVQRVLKQ